MSLHSSSLHRIPEIALVWLTQKLNFNCLVSVYYILAMREHEVLVVVPLLKTAGCCHINHLDQTCTLAITIPGERCVNATIFGLFQYYLYLSIYCIIKVFHFIYRIHKADSGFISGYPSLDRQRKYENYIQGEYLMYQNLQ